MGSSEGGDSDVCDGVPVVRGLVTERIAPITDSSDSPRNQDALPCMLSLALALDFGGCGAAAEAEALGLGESGGSSGAVLGTSMETFCSSATFSTLSTLKAKPSSSRASWSDSSSGH